MRDAINDGIDGGTAAASWLHCQIQQKDCRKKVVDNQNKGTNRVTFQKGPSRGRGRGRGKARGNSSRGRGTYKGKGKGRFIRAITNGDEETNEEPEEELDGLAITINATLAGATKEHRDQILQQLQEGFM